MGVGVSLILIAAGAILAWAVDVSTAGFNVNTVGYILLIVGIIGLIVSMIFWSSWAGPGFFTRGGGRRVVEEDVVDRPRRRVIEEDL
jgi:hypothetical protein